MGIGTPPIQNGPQINQDRVVWSKPWGNWFTQVFQALMGWNSTFYANKTHDFGLINAHAQATTTLTITSVRSSGSNVEVTAETPTSGILLDGYVSSDNTVTIRAHNYTAGNIDPASSVFNVIVKQQ